MARSRSHDAGRRALQQKHGLGAWTLSGAFYGPSVAAIEPQIARVRDHFMKPGSAAAGRDQRLLRHSQPRRTRPAEMAAGRRQHLVPAGARRWTARSPTNSRTVPQDHEDHGLDYMVMDVCGPRFARRCMSSRLIARILTSGRGRTPAIAGCRRRSPNAACSWSDHAFRVERLLDRRAGLLEARGRYGIN